MESISHLCRLWSALARPSRVITSSITADQFNFWMRPHPGSSGFCLPVRQEVNHVVALHVNQDAAEFPATTEGEVIYSQLHYLFYWRGWSCHYAAENGHPARLYP
jgi:hypothetical protein